MNIGPAREKNSGISCAFMKFLTPLKMCECFQTFKTAMEMPFRAVRVGV
jgi:hypothetical protein